MTNLIGTDGLGPLESTYLVNKYPQYKQTYYGASASVAYSASIYYSKGWQVDITQGNPYTMVATLQCELQSDGITPVTGTGSYVTVNWSMHYESTAKELLECNANVISWINQIVPSDRIMLQGYLNNPPKSGTIDWTTFSTSSLSVSSSQTIWAMAQTGFRTVPVNTPILRETVIVPSTFNMTGFNTNLGSIYSVSTLSSFVPSNWIAIMPMGTDPSSTTTGGIPYHYGWQRQPPTQDQNGTTITITQEYKYGLWPQNIFGTVL